MVCLHYKPATCSPPMGGLIAIEYRLAEKVAQERGRRAATFVFKAFKSGVCPFFVFCFFNKSGAG